MLDARPLSSSRNSRHSTPGSAQRDVAGVVLEELQREGVQTTLIDVRQLPLSTTDAGEGIKDHKFSEAVMGADGLVIVAPEYNHGYPGILKHARTRTKEYIHKPVGLCGVSAGGFGGTRVVESLLPVMRELGMVTIFWDVNVPGAGKAFDNSVSCSTRRCRNASTKCWAN